MKASELRIGNIVSIYSNGTVKIPCYPIKKKILRVGIFKCNCININENLAQVEKWDEIESNMLAPIPLTEDILLKCGGIVEGGGYKSIIVLNGKGEGCGYILHSDGYIGVLHHHAPMRWYQHINTLHQFQNLYYIEQNKELKVEL